MASSSSGFSIHHPAAGDEEESCWDVSGAYVFPETSRLFQLAWLAYGEMKASDRFVTKQVQIASVDRIKSTNDDNYFPNAPNFARRLASTVKLCMTTACGITEPPKASAPFSCPASAAGVRLYRQPEDTPLFRLGAGDEAGNERYVGLFEQMFPVSLIEREMKGSARRAGGAAGAGSSSNQLLSDTTAGAGNKSVFFPRRMLIFRTNDVVEIKTSASLRDPSSPAVVLTTTTTTTPSTSSETTTSTATLVNREGVYNCAVTVSCRRAEIAHGPLDPAYSSSSPSMTEVHCNDERGGPGHCTRLRCAVFGPYYQHLKAICWPGEPKLGCLKVSQAFPTHVRDEDVQAEEECRDEEKNFLLMVNDQRRATQVLRREMQLYKEDQAHVAGTMQQNAFAMRDMIEELREEILELRNENALYREELGEVRADQEKMMQSKICVVL